MTGSSFRWNITDVPASEVTERRKRAFKKAHESAPDAMLFFTSTSIFYMLGAWISATERPVCLIIKNDNTAYMLVPKLEEEHCASIGKCLTGIYSYDEYPGKRHPMLFLREILETMNLQNSSLLADRDGYPTIMGYRGPKLSEICPNARIVEMPFLVEELQMTKSPFDITVMRETARWGNFAHTLLQEYTRAGMHEFDVVNQVRQEATGAMLRTLGSEFNARGPVEAHARAIFRGQIGKLSYWPHVTANNAIIRRGDNLITGASGFILGLRTEMERTMFVGEPSPLQQRYYSHVLALQEIGICAIRPGRTCSQVDREVRRYYEENGLEVNWLHHTGHCIGYAGHERPFLDAYDETVIQPGMVFTCEPGLYVKDVGGFRISDTLLVTENGVECLTYFPKSLDKVVCDR